jgi:hypothetical protein
MKAYLMRYHMLFETSTPRHDMPTCLVGCTGKLLTELN